MFKITQNTMLFQDGLPSEFKSKLKKTFSIGALASVLFVSNVAQAEDLSNRPNSFRDYITTPTEAHESDNTVMLVMKSIDGRLLSWGTGSIIADSGNHQNPHNRILTSWQSAEPDLFEKLNGNTNASPFGAIYIFDNKGNILGVGEITAHGKDSNILSTEASQVISANLAVVAVNPVNQTYDMKSGVTIAPTIPANIYSLQSSNGIGPGPGFSGSPTFSSNGELIGVAVRYKSEGPSVPVCEEMTPNDHINLPENLIGQPMISIQDAKGNLTNPIPKESRIIIAPLSPSILEALNDAGQNVQLSNKNPSSVEILGYTNNVAVVKKGVPQLLEFK